MTDLLTIRLWNSVYQYWLNIVAYWRQKNGSAFLFVDFQFSHPAFLRHLSSEASNFASSPCALLSFSFRLSSLNLASCSQCTSVSFVDQGCHEFSLHRLSSATINFQLSAKDKRVEYEVLTAVVMKISYLCDDDCHAADHTALCPQR
jgi:hypothetical protein